MLADLSRGSQEEQSSEGTSPAPAEWYRPGVGRWHGAGGGQGRPSGGVDSALTRDADDHATHLIPWGRHEFDNVSFVRAIGQPLVERKELSLVASEARVARSHQGHGQGQVQSRSPRPDFPGFLCPEAVR